MAYNSAYTGAVIDRAGQLPATSAGTTGQFLQKNGTSTQWADASAAKIFNNISVATSAWASNTTYAEFPYRAQIALSGVTVNHYVEIVFDLINATSGIFAPICESYSGGVYIYANTIPSSSLTIPTIIAMNS